MEGQTNTGLRVYFTRWWNHITPATRIFLVICVSLYICELLLGSLTYAVCLAPILIKAQYHQAYRVLTSPFFHGGALHLLLNMMSYCYTGPYFEKRVGTLQYIYLILVFAIGSNLLVLSAALALALNPVISYPNLLWQCVIGFSAVIFSLLVIECHYIDTPRSVYGVFSVSSKFYPWVALCIAQLMLPNVSFFGHLAGMAMGYLYIYDFLIYITPSTQKLERLESLCSKWIASLRGFVRAPDTSILPLYSATTDKAQIFKGQGHILGTSIAPL